MVGAMRIEANLDGVYQFTGGVSGVLRAVESPGFKDDFTDHIMNGLKARFTTDAIAASGAPSMKHVFEWGPSEGDSSIIPLFRLTKKGRGGKKQLGYYFVPSTVPVPLPDPGRYGFDPSKLDHMKRHIFKYKAIVMESGASVNITHKWSEKGLFIPMAGTKYGYIMTKKPVTVMNPGGTEATGGFSQFWTTWFEAEAPVYIKQQTNLTEQFIGKVARTVLRNKKGQFASGKGVGISYASSAEKTAEIAVKTKAKQYFSDGPLDDWDEGE